MTPTTDQLAASAESNAASSISTAESPTTPPPDSPGRGVVPVLAFAGITVAVMQTLLVPVIKDLPALLTTSPANATWVMTATLLAGAVATPIMGRLGDLHGKRRMLLVSLAVMVAGSLLCGLTDDLLTMIVGRALQGFAMGAIPLGIGLMRDVLPVERLGSAMALMSSSIGVGGGLALPVAALVAQHADWHALFFCAAGLGVLAVALALALVPESPVRAAGRFDVVGALGLSAGLVCLLLPVTKGSDWGWGSPRTLGMLGAAVALLVLWGLLELRLRDPLVDLRTTARREVLLTNLTSVMVGVAFYAISLVLPQLLQLPRSFGGLGRSMVVAGLCVAPLGLTMMLTAPLYARISARRGPKTSLIAGMLVIAVGYGAGTGLMSATWQTVLVSVVVGAGIGLAYSSLPALIIGAVDPSETGAANGLNTLMRSLGTSVSSAVIGMVLARTATHAGGAVVPTLHGFRTSFLIATGAVAVGLLLALFLPSRRTTVQPRLLAGGENSPAVEGPALAGEAMSANQAAPAAAFVAHGFTGHVTDEAGRAVPGARVTLVDRSGRQAGRARTDRTGWYALDTAAPGTFVLSVAAAGHRPYASTAVAVAGGGPGPLDVRLTRARRLPGVLRGGGGRPVAAGVVVVTDAAGEVIAGTTTRAGGQWELTDLPPGAYTLTLSAPGHLPAARYVEVDEGGDPAQRPHEVTLTPAAALRGRVRDRDGRLTGLAVVSLTRADGAVLGAAVTGRDGAFAFDHLTAGAYTLRVSGPAAAAVRVDLSDGARRELDVVVADEPGAGHEDLLPV
ncbi:MFS transporter [Streptomyces sp. NPDC059740]|uniref:MFS transporter n=1 Tax=Streptomyces sp. NPDC059740 TaxID=3346926 RepID=UPI00364FA887